jgi:hypothetical protein
MPTYRVEVEHTTTTREILEVDAQSVGDAETRANIYENNSRRDRADVRVVTPRDVFPRRSASFVVLSAREKR